MTWAFPSPIIPNEEDTDSEKDNSRNQSMESARGKIIQFIPCESIVYASITINLLYIFFGVSKNKLFEKISHFACRTVLTLVQCFFSCGVKRKKMMMMTDGMIQLHRKCELEKESDTLYLWADRFELYDWMRKSLQHTTAAERSQTVGRIS